MAKRIVRIEQGKVVEAVDLPAALQAFKLSELCCAALTWIDVSGRTDVTVGWRYDGAAFTAPAAAAHGAAVTPAQPAAPASTAPAS